jgi:hypothetical protein
MGLHPHVYLYMHAHIYILWRSDRVAPSHHGLCRHQAHRITPCVYTQHVHIYTCKHIAFPGMWVIHPQLFSDTHA